jgi:glycolate oxidase FAD binding subunit
MAPPVAERIGARPGGEDDAVLDVVPALVARPESAQELAQALALSAREGLAVCPRGRGTKLGYANPPARLDLLVETGRIDALVEHAAGDLVVTAGAGMRLADLQSAVAREGQMLALDPPEDGTLGGTVAANASGPRRLRYGTARDLVIGITVALADGTIAKAGGKVVKNVAGYDLGKLFTGSLGTLGVIVETTFRLHPLPAARRTVVVELDSLGAAGAAAAALTASTLVPSALEVASEAPPARPALAVLFEGVEPGAEAQATRAASLLAPHGDARILDEADAAALWPRLAQRPWEPGDAGLKLRAPIAELCLLLAEAQDAAQRAGLATRIAAHAASGIGYLALRGSDDALAPAVRAIRAAAEGRGGSAVVHEAAPALRREVETFGSVGDALGLMRRVKEQFDPEAVLSPGRFVGGI